MSLLPLGCSGMPSNGSDNTNQNANQNLNQNENLNDNDNTATAVLSEVRPAVGRAGDQVTLSVQDLDVNADIKAFFEEANPQAGSAPRLLEGSIVSAVEGEVLVVVPEGVLMQQPWSVFLEQSGAATNELPFAGAGSLFSGQWTIEVDSGFSFEPGMECPGGAERLTWYFYPDGVFSFCGTALNDPDVGAVCINDGQWSVTGTTVSAELCVDDSLANNPEVAGHALEGTWDQEAGILTGMYTVTYYLEPDGAQSRTCDYEITANLFDVPDYLTCHTVACDSDPRPDDFFENYSCVTWEPILDSN